MHRKRWWWRWITAQGQGTPGRVGHLSIRRNSYLFVTYAPALRELRAKLCWPIKSCFCAKVSLSATSAARHLSSHTPACRYCQSDNLGTSVWAGPRLSWGNTRAFLCSLFFFPPQELWMAVLSTGEIPRALWGFGVKTCSREINGSFAIDFGGAGLHSWSVDCYNRFPSPAGSPCNSVMDWALLLLETNPLA